MPSISVNSANLAASTRTGNIIAGDPNEFLNYPATVRVYQVSSASGIRSSILADTDVVVDDKEILAIGTSVDTSAHLFAEFDVEAGTRLSVFLRETAAVATTDVLTLIDIEAL
jgi:hypothetical protein